MIEAAAFLVLIVTGWFVMRLSLRRRRVRRFERAWSRASTFGRRLSANAMQNTMVRR